MTPAAFRHPKLCTHPAHAVGRCRSAEVSRACRTAVQKRPTHAQPTVFGRISKREGRLSPREEKLEVSPLRSAHWPAFAPVEMTGFFSMGGFAALLVTQRLDGIEGGGFSGGVEAEEDADGGAEEEGSDDGRGRDHHGPFGEERLACRLSSLPRRASACIPPWPRHARRLRFCGRFRTAPD